MKSGHFRADDAGPDVPVIDPPPPTPLEVLQGLADLWRAVKDYDRIGFEGSHLLEVMSDARELVLTAENQMDVYYIIGPDPARR